MIVKWRSPWEIQEFYKIWPGQGVRGRKSPSGVQKQSSYMESGRRSPPEAEAKREIGVQF